MKILITGIAGFIGFHLAKRLLDEGINVVGIDNLNPYYDPTLKNSRLDLLQAHSKSVGAQLAFFKGCIDDHSFVFDIFNSTKPQVVVNLAAQAGVRYSIENPSAYIQSNIVGFANILEACRHSSVKHLIYASSSSVYGGNAQLPFSEAHSVDHPVSLYAATKKSNELMAHTYSSLYSLPTTGLRFFTVYGPWGRPDMALFLFTKAILEGNPIKVFNQGQMTRDFTFIDDIVESLLRLLRKPATADTSFDPLAPNASTSWCPYRIFNIGNSTPTSLMDYIHALELSLGIKAIKEMLPMQPGDVANTASDTSSLESWIDFKPYTPISLGVSRFVDWYRNFYNY